MKYSPKFGETIEFLNEGPAEISDLIGTKILPIVRRFQRYKLVLQKAFVAAEDQAYNHNMFIEHCSI